MSIKTDYLSLKWSTSRGQDTYGYNICKLTDRLGRSYKTCGGGYDMRGTVLGEWLQNNYQDRLLALKGEAHAVVDAAGKYITKSDPGTRRSHGIYGMCYYMAVYHKNGKLKSPERIGLDGGCGAGCMEDIAALIGISLSSTGNRKGHITGYMVTDYGSAEALKAARGY